MAGTATAQKATRLADIVVGQAVDQIWFVTRVPGGTEFLTSYVTRWEGNDEDGNRQVWSKKGHHWERVA